MDKGKLKTILDQNQRWMTTGGKEGEMADLTGANLREANLNDVDLRGADLRGADLSGADLSGAYLRSADLSGAYLTGAYLSEAYLSRANLNGANLRGADLRNADLSRTNLSEADLSGADLGWALFNFCNLSDCKGVKLLLKDPRYDSKGYQLVAWSKDGRPWYNSGCRSFPKNEALFHWGGKNYPDKKLGNWYVDAINFSGSPLPIPNI